MMREQEDVPDPNHREEIILIDSDEELADSLVEEEQNTPSQEERSSYFPNERVNAFNERCR